MESEKNPNESLIPFLRKLADSIENHQLLPQRRLPQVPAGRYMSMHAHIPMRFRPGGLLMN